MIKKIQMVDLYNQFNSIKKDIFFEFDKIFESTSFINGPIVKEFQYDLEKYLDVNNVIPCANGTDALQIIMMSYGFKRNSEIIVPSFTYVATVEVIALLGLKPVFVEVDPITFNIDIDDIQKNLTKNTAAIVPVHLYGQCANMEEIKKIVQGTDIKIIEDTAQALGARFKFSNNTFQKAGTIGDAGSTSFFPSKNLGCYGDGGAIFTNDEDFAKKIKMISNHGQSKKYYHDSIGVNSRLDSLQAAILKVKLKRLDTYNLARKNVAEKYNDAFSNIHQIETPKTSSFSNHVYHQYTLKINDLETRNSLISFLNNNNIPSMIYYPIPNHLQLGYKNYGYKLGDLPITENLCERVLSLPIHTEMDENTQDYIISKILGFFDK